MIDWATLNALEISLHDQARTKSEQDAICLFVQQFFQNELNDWVNKIEKELKLDKILLGDNSSNDESRPKAHSNETVCMQRIKAILPHVLNVAQQKAYILSGADNVDPPHTVFTHSEPTYEELMHMTMQTYFDASGCGDHPTAVEALKQIQKLKEENTVVTCSTGIHPEVAGFE